VELIQVTHTSKDIRDAAELILDQALIQGSGVGIFEELGFVVDAEGKRVYVTDDARRLTKVIDRIDRGGKTYFLGNC
jgi:hypothetical protein